MSFDWIDDVPVDDTAMTVIKSVVAEYRTLVFNVQQKEAELKYAQEQLQKCVADAAKLLRSNGMEAIKCEDGTMIEVVQNVKCSVVKDRKQEVADWLRDRDMGDMVKSQLIVMESAKQRLDEMGIGYDEDLSMNTNSIKAYVRGEMERGNLSVDELPKGLSWFQYDDLKVR